MLQIFSKLTVTKRLIKYRRMYNLYVIFVKILTTFKSCSLFSLFCLQCVIFFISPMSLFRELIRYIYESIQKSLIN